MQTYLDFIQNEIDIVENFIDQLIDGSNLEYLLEALPTTDFIKELRKIGVDNAKKLGLDSLEHFERRLHTGFKAATDEILKNPDQVEKQTKQAYDLFHQFLHERTVAANLKATNPSENKTYSEKNKTLFTGTNKKTELSTKQGVLPRGLSLPPFNSAYPKFNCCPSATKECKASCLGLYAGGSKLFPETAFLGKLIRLQFMVEYPKEAAYLIHAELKENEKVSNQKGFLPGFRANITSDIDFIKLFPKEFFDTLHKDTQFYDYTKDVKRLAPTRDESGFGTIVKPKNYFLSLSHTGTNHKESNDKDAVAALDAGHVVTMVVYGGKGNARKDLKDLEIKGVKDDATGKIYPVANGDNDDNIFDRHQESKLPKNKGIVNIVKLKGAKREKAGLFANNIGTDGYVHINSKN